MMNIAKQCNNDPVKYYYGTEMSPLRFGLSASGYDLDVVMKGHDKLNWVVKMKNNRKVWVRLVIPNKIIHEDIKDEGVIAIVKSNDNDKKELAIEKESIAEVKPDKKTKKSKDVKENAPEKKMTDYNIFLAYRLNELKKKYSEENSKKTNKEIFTEVLKEWKSMNKKSKEFEEIIKNARNS